MSAEEKQPMTAAETYTPGVGDDGGATSPSGAPDSTDAGRPSNTSLVTVHRSPYSQEALQQTFMYHEPEKPSCKERLSNSIAKQKKACSGACVLQMILGFFPFITQFRGYKPREYLLGDVLAGLTVTVVHIPQSMGFALLASVQPVYGLYSSFWHVLVYLFVGASPHVSVGTMALISLMLSEVVDQQAEKYIQDYQSTNGNHTGGPPEEELELYKIQVACATSLLVGILQVLMSVVHLGIITSLMSTSLVVGFTMGAAVHIATSQLKTLFGVAIPAYNGLGKAPVTWYRILENLPDTHVATLVVSIICMVLLIAMKEGINENFKDKLKVQVPAELVVVALATVISYFISIDEKYEVKILGEIPIGFPAPFVPDVSESISYFKEIFVMAIISFVITFSMSDTFSRKHNYEVEANRELCSQGLCNAIPSFFYSFAGSAAPPRCVLLSTQGAKTHVASVVTCGILLLVILVLGTYFEYLPIAALSCIVIVALFPMFKQIREAKRYWAINKMDFLIWFVTFISVVCISVDLGLFIGIIAALLSLPLSGCATTGQQLLPAKSADLYCDSVKYKKLEQQPGIRVFRFESNLYFAVKQTFKSQLYKIAGKPNIQKKKSKASVDISTGMDYSLLIIDCSCISYIDIVGINLLNVLHKDYGKVDVKLVLAGCSDQLLMKLANCAAVSEGSDKIATYPTIQDAIASEV